MPQRPDIVGKAITQAARRRGFPRREPKKPRASEGAHANTEASRPTLHIIEDFHPLNAVREKEQ